MLVSSLRKLAILVLPVALALMPRPASAQCAFDGLAKSKPIKLSMVRSYIPCAPPNATYAGEPACSPVTVTDVGDGPTPYQFGPKGGCTVSLKGAIEDDCSTLTNNGSSLGLPAGPCHVTYVKAKCSGILEADNQTPIKPDADAGWSLLAMIRYSVNDQTNSDVTLPDAPVPFFGFGYEPVYYPFDDPDKGSISLESNSAIVLSNTISPAYAALPPCANAQIVSLEILDPGTRVFAVPGFETR
jgi:hypothetical protein